MPSSDPVTDEHAREVCKIGQEAACCRFLTMGPFGWSCEKLSPLGPLLTRRAELGEMSARADNCGGRASR